VPRKLHKIAEISRIRQTDNILQQNIIQTVEKNAEFSRKPVSNTENPRVGGSIPSLGTPQIKGL
jgi:hypothetical protein